MIGVNEAQAAWDAFLRARRDTITNGEFTVEEIARAELSALAHGMKNAPPSFKNGRRAYNAKSQCQYTGNQLRAEWLAGWNYERRASIRARKP
jgi:ribonuclease HI